MAIHYPSVVVLSNLLFLRYANPLDIRMLPLFSDNGRKKGHFKDRVKIQDEQKSKRG